MRWILAPHSTGTAYNSTRYAPLPAHGRSGPRAHDFGRNEAARCRNSLLWLNQCAPHYPTRWVRWGGRRICMRRGLFLDLPSCTNRFLTPCAAVGHLLAYSARFSLNPGSFCMNISCSAIAHHLSTSYNHRPSHPDRAMRPYIWQGRVHDVLGTRHVHAHQATAALMQQAPPSHQGLTAAN